MASLLNLSHDPDNIRVGGDAFTLYCTHAGYKAAGTAGVSYRQILDLADLNQAAICIPPGNSGQPGSAHYGDNVAKWLDCTYHPLFVDARDIEANKEAELVLVRSGGGGGSGGASGTTTSRL
jgi:penicillin amidase